MKILLLKFLMKSAKKGAIYNPPKNLPVGSRKGQNCPSGRPPGRPANGHFLTVVPQVDRLFDRDWI